MMSDADGDETPQLEPATAPNMPNLNPKQEAVEEQQGVGVTAQPGIEGNESAEDKPTRLDDRDDETVLQSSGFVFSGFIALDARLCSDADALLLLYRLLLRV